MSAESAFRDNCGPNVEFVSTETFDNGRWRDFTFRVGDRVKAVGVKMVSDAPDDERLGAEAGRRAKEWADKHRSKVDV